MLEVTLQYGTLISLAVAHEYYADGPVPGVTLVPEQATEQLLSQLGLFIKHHEDALRLVYSLDQAAALVYRLEQDQTLEFRFRLYSTNSYFSQISNLPLDLRNQAFWFQNHRNSLTEVTLLHAGEFASTPELHPLHSSELIVPPSAEGRTEVSSSAQRVVYEGAQGESGTLDLAEAGEDFYELRENGKVTQRLVYIAPEQLLRRSARQLGTVCIRLTAADQQQIADHLRIASAPPLFQYQIRFQSRPLYWRYFIIPRKETIEIVDVKVEGQEDIQFTPLQTIEINGQKAYFVQTTRPIPLKAQLPGFIARLVLQSGTANKVLASRLPIPAPEAIVGVTEEVGTGNNRHSELRYYADMRVFV